MMHKKYRLITGILCILLCAALMLTAIAEGPLSTLYRAGIGLLCETDNASVHAYAEFYYNGMPFKKMDLTYKQAGTDSFMDLKLLTPDGYDSVKESGYTVVANGPVAYSIEPVLNPRVYSAANCAESDSILSTTVLRRAALRLGAAVADAAEPVLGSRIAAVQTGNGTEYHAMIAEGEAPALVNAAGTLMAQIAAERYFYTGYSWKDSILEEVYGEDFDYFYDDYDAVFALYYQKMFDRPLPPDFYEVLWGEDEEAAGTAYEEYSQVTDLMHREISLKMEGLYDTGIAVIRANGETDYYADQTAYILDNDMQQVCYADYSAAFLAYYGQKTGQSLTEAGLNAIYYSDNEALWEAYTAMGEEMEQAYMDQLKADPKAAVLYVDTEMGTHMVYDYEAYMRASGIWNDMTMKDFILARMEKLELGDTDVTVTLDNEGRLTAARGTVKAVVLDRNDKRGDLEIVFDVTVWDYGKTSVEKFDPKQYGTVTWEEFWEAPEKYPITEEMPETGEADLPETLVFDGISYKIRVD